MQNKSVFKPMCAYALFALSLLVARADIWTDPEAGYTWTYRISGSTAVIYGNYKGSPVQSPYSPGISPLPTGHVTIPSVLGGRPVTAIGSGMFEGCLNMTSVTMPDSVTSIGQEAFAYCYSLIDVAIPHGVSYIGAKAFYNCKNLEDVTIPEGVAEIGSQAFNSCSELKSMKIPNSTTFIGDYAFADCSKLESFSVSDDNRSYKSDSGLLLSKDGKTLISGVNGDVIVPYGVTSIGDLAFCGHSGLTSVIIPSSVAKIGKDAFMKCSGLTSVTIPNGVMSIGDNAFSGCSGLTNVMIPDSVTSIGQDAFINCIGLTNIVVGEGNAQYMSRNGLLLSKDGRALMRGVNGDIIIPEGVTSIEECAFLGCASLSSVTIPSSVTSIKRGAFWGCSGLKSVTIPSSVTSIGQEAFNGCIGLTSVTIPNSVMSIGHHAFNNCDGLTNLVILCSATSIGSYAFFGCTNVAHLIAAYCPSGLDRSRLPSVTIPSGVTSIGDSAFSGCTALTSVTIPDSVTNIGISAFSYCSGLMSMTIPDGVTCIEDSVFFGCSGLTSVTIPSGVTSIGDGAFSGCTALTSVTIPSGVTSIGGSAFSSCTALTSVTIPNGVMIVEDNVFSSCSGLTHIMIPNGITNIADGAFSYCSGLTNVTIPNSVASVGGHAFYSCSGLRSVTIPDSVRRIGQYVLGRCHDLKEVYLPDRFRGTLAESVFYDCPYDVEIFYYSESTRIPHEQLFAEDSSEMNVVLSVTNDCRVTFDWRCSCEPMRKGKMRDYLSFSKDGVQQDAICGEVDWTAREFIVEGDGEHVLRWTYQKDASDSEGEDCGWIRLVSVVPRVTLSFLPGEATTGEPPESMSFYADGGNVLLPGCGTLAWPRHTFGGWSDGTTDYAAGSVYSCDAAVRTLTATWRRNELSAPVIDAPSYFESDSCTIAMTSVDGADIRYTIDGSAPTAESLLYTEPIVVDATTTVRAIAVRNDYFDSPVATLTVTKTATMSLGETVNAPLMEFVTNPETGWRRVRDESPDGYALRSGAISHNATSRIETVVNGEGQITFSCKVAGEVIKGDVYDGLAFLIDGVPQGELMGNTDWETNTFDVVGEGSHTLSWLYVKDEGDEEVLPDDCAWIDEVVWAADGSSDPIPTSPSIQFETNDVSWTQLADGSWRSDETDDDATNSLSATISGEGTVAFRWKTSCEGYFDFKGTLLRQDGLSFFVDGEELAFTNGVMSAWAECSFEIDGAGKHTIEWAYVKDGSLFDGEDCVWVAGITWTPSAVDVVVDAGGGKTVTVPSTWLDGYAEAISAQGVDRATYAQSTAANGRDKVWECFVAGISPTNETASFTATIEFKDGAPVVKWEPDLNTNGVVRTYKVYGRETLEKGDEWQYPTNSLHKFFKVTVEMP